MTTTRIPRPSLMRLTRIALIVMLAAAGTAACAHARMMLGGTGAARPAASEFGLGPRRSAQGMYTATMTPGQPLRPRQLQSVRVIVADATGRPIDDAVIAVGGGMPQHGHGLPTAPRVTRNLGGGVYEIEGVRFNMGGWWEFTLDITAGPGQDRLTFNLDL